MNPFNSIHEHKVGTRPPEVRGPPPDPGGRIDPRPGELGGNQDEGRSGLSDHPWRVERLGQAKARAAVLLQHLEASKKALVRACAGTDVEPLHVLGKLCRCGDYLKFRFWYTIDDCRLVEAFFCQQHLLCAVCAIRRGVRMMNTYIPKVEELTRLYPHLHPVLITLTVRNGADLVERMEHLRRGIRVLMERRRDKLKKGRGRTEFSKVAGAIASIEVTYGKGGWHPHVHMVALLSDWIDQQAFSREWYEITGDSFVVGVQRVDPMKPIAFAMAEVCKYALKFSDLTPQQTWDCFTTLRGRRLVFSFGCFWGLQVPETLTDDLRDDDLPYIDLLYRFSFGERRYKFCSDPSLVADALDHNSREKGP